MADCDPTSRRRVATVVTWLLVIVGTIGPGIMWIFTPESADDLWYRHEFNEFIREGYDIGGAILAQLAHRIEIDNIRLPNILFVLQLPLECEWLAGVFLTGCMAVLLLYIRKLFGGICVEPVAMAAVIGAMLIFFPWEEYMFSHDFAMNYFFPSALTVVSFYYFVRLIIKKDFSHPCVCYVIWVITGFSHESFSIPLFVSFVAYGIFFGSHDRRVWFAALILLPGIILFACTSLVVRYNTSVGIITTYGSDSLRPGFKLAILLTVGITLYVLWKRFRRRRALSESDIILFMSAVIMAVSVAIRMALHGTERSGWCALLFGMIVVPIILFRKKFFCRKKAYMAQLIFSILVLVGITIHFTSSAIDTFRLRAWYYPAIDKLCSSGKGQIFCDMCGLKDYNLCSLGRPFRRFSMPSYEQEWISIYYTGEDKFLVFLPAELADVNVAPGRKVAGNNPFYEKDGFLYCPESLWPSGESRRWIVDGHWNVHYELKPFETSDSSRYFYATCYNVFLAKLRADTINPAQ